ncbi:unnamed protein product [Candidula unifasciata]|uniref:Methyltransferase domain-containing protein n=1 Tax=Candidula unifasciata TaxID=100452 RepID=A0A8S3ZDB2_9EUPU|nr:unnamed protein product [Candidula unifasciata]
MKITIKRYALVAYVAVLCSACVLLWMLVFISSDDVVSPLGKMHRTSENDAALDYGSKNVMNPDGDNTYGQTRGHQVKPVLLPDSTALRNMSWQDLSNLYHTYLNVNQIKCSDILRVGHVTDGGWDVCNDRPYAPKEPCIVYSFGVGDDFSFDDAVVRHFGCKVYSFDPSMAMNSKQRSDKAFFYKQGIADSDRTLPNGWQMSRFESFRAGLKHMKIPISIVKLDIEEWEWEVLPDILASGHLASVNQLLLELHQCEGCSVYNPQQEDKEPPRDRYIHMLELLLELYKQNFRLFHHHPNSACVYLSKFTMTQRSACIDVGFLRIS